MAGLVPAIHVFGVACVQDVDARDKPGHDGRENKNEQAIPGFPKNRLLVEDLTAFGYPRPAPLLAAGDHVFFEDRTAEPANRSTAINLFPCRHISCI
jgi:hypothetical protein